MTPLHLWHPLVHPFLPNRVPLQAQQRIDQAPQYKAKSQEAYDKARLKLEALRALRPAWEEAQRVCKGSDGGGDAAGRTRSATVASSVVGGTRLIPSPPSKAARMSTLRAHPCTLHDVRTRVR